MNKWLNRQPTWRFALMIAGLDLTVLLIGLGVVWLTNKGRVNVGFFAGYIPVMVVALTGVAVFNRRRNQQRTETERPRGR